MNNINISDSVFLSKMIHIQQQQLKTYPYLEVPNKRCYAAVGLVVVFLMGKLLQLRQERNGISRREEGQQVRG